MFILNKSALLEGVETIFIQQKSVLKSKNKIK